MEKTALALGTFDGLHLGHLAVLNKAAQDGCRVYAITFDVPPKSTLSKTKIPVIFTNRQKCKFLEQMGIVPVVLDFETVKDLQPLQFLEQIFKQYQPKKIVCGFNFVFGKNAAGTTKTLQQFCNEKAIEFCMVDAVYDEQQVVSSTFIRGLIEQGNIEKANRLCLKPFTVQGRVIHGAGRGKTLGFPTVNLRLDDGRVLPKFGVYAGHTTVDDKTYYSVSNVGIRPTFSADEVLVETYIFDFDRTVYGQDVLVTLECFLRPEQKFENAAALKAAVEQDKTNALKWLKK